MKTTELRTKDVDGLKTEVKALQKAHFGLRMQKATQQLTNNALLRSARRDDRGGPRPGADRAAPRGARRPPMGGNAAPADGSDKPAEAIGADANKPAVQRVRKVAAPAAAADGKGE